MAIVLVQSITSGGTTITLNGVVAGNLLTLQDSYFRSSGTGLAETAPTDTQGTWSTASAGVPGVNATFESGCGIFYQANVAAGTHTVTPQGNSNNNTTLCEWSGISTSSPADASASSKTDSGGQTSQVTGTTGTTAQADELVLIALGLAASGGSADVGFTDPVTGFTTQQKISNDA
jgi:hypothetical protein